MIGRIRLWIIAASVVSLAALSAVSWLSYRNTKELIAANQRLAQAHKLIEDLAALHVLLDDAESSCRDYALSGRTESLKPYEAALAQLDTTMRVLRRDLAADPNHSQQLQELEPVIKLRLEAMKELVQARSASALQRAADQGSDRAAEPVVNDACGSCAKAGHKSGHSRLKQLCREML